MPPEDYVITEAVGAVIFNPCPASIWLLGAAAQCNKQRGHEGNHTIMIEWEIR